MSTRPADWAPLSGGDPCPGDPEAYSAVIQHWGDRASDAQGQAAKLASIVSNDAESNRVRRVEQVAAEGKAALESMARTFDEVQELLRGWQQDLGEMQTRADEALAKAQDAHTTVEDSSAQMGALGAFAAQKKQDEQGRAKKAHLVQEMAAAQATIDAAQQTVDNLRGEYERKSSAVVAAYVLNVSGLWSVDGKSSAGGFGVSVADVKDTFLGQLSESKARELEDAAAHVGDGPGQYEAYLELLAGTDAGALAQFFGEHPELARYPLAGTGDVVWDTAMVKAWWGRLGADQQQALVQNASGVVGNLNGVPYGARDEANRALLEDLKGDESLTPGTQQALEQLSSASQGEDKFIITLDISPLKKEDGIDTNDVRAAVSVGDLDTAKNTSFVGPGMGNDLAAGATTQVQVAKNIRNQQAHVADRSKNDFAVVAWLGYDAPDLTKTIKLDASRAHRADQGSPYSTNQPSQSVLKPDLAQQGARDFARALDGFNVTRTLSSTSGESISVDAVRNASEDQRRDFFNVPDVDVIGHSYGTTMVGEALPQLKTSVNSVALVGSAGLTAEAIAAGNAGRFHIDKGSDGQENLYFTHAQRDMTAPTGSVPSGRKTPDQLSFAKEFSAEGGVDGEGKVYVPTHAHGALAGNFGEAGYFAENTSSLAMVALATTSSDGGKLPELIHDESAYVPGAHLNGYALPYSDEQLSADASLRAKVMAKQELRPEDVYRYSKDSR